MFVFVYIIFIKLIGGDMKEKINRYALISVGILSSLVLLFAIVEYLLPVILPFLIAWMVAAITSGPARSLSLKIKAPEGIIRLVMSLMIIIIFFSSLTILIWQGAVAIFRFLSDIDEGSRLYEVLNTILSPDAPLFGDYLPEGLADGVSGAIERMISGGISMLVDGITSLAAALPQLFFFILVTLISLVYFALDYDKIRIFLTKLLPQKAVDIMGKVKSGILFVIKKYIFSYALILLITYTTLLIGLSILGVGHVAVVALFIALLDILPIIGVGTVLLPWGIFELVTANRFLGIGLIALFVINAIIRQFTEPKIVGKSLDIHPIATLMMIYVGYALFGLIGMLILPIIIVSLGAILKRDNSAEIG